MQNIIIISTEHVESGKCNSNELLKILELIQPEVIFEEEPNDDKYHNSYADQNSFKSLEVQTIVKYKQNHNVLNHPVDKPINEFASIHLLDQFTKMFRQNEDYRNIINELCILRNENGFKFLNSKACSNLNEKLKTLEKQIILSNCTLSNDLIQLYNQFQQEVYARETKMIENIYYFTKNNKFKNAVFFLGFRHRESIRKLISKFKIEDSTNINWMFYEE
jgi:hypothetical protein